MHHPEILRNAGIAKVTVIVFLCSRIDVLGFLQRVKFYHREIGEGLMLRNEAG